MSRKLASKLKDQKGKYSQYHNNTNILRMKLFTRKDICILLPTSESTFRHRLRSYLPWNDYWQTKTIIGSPKSYGWKEGKSGLEPILFEGPMSSDFLQIWYVIKIWRNSFPANSSQDMINFNHYFGKIKVYNKIRAHYQTLKTNGILLILLNYPIKSYAQKVETSKIHVFYSYFVTIQI